MNQILLLPFLVHIYSGGLFSKIVMSLIRVCVHSMQIDLLILCNFLFPNFRLCAALGRIR